MVPETVAMTTFPNETIVSTPREVATIDWTGRSVNRLREGTMIKPPPTPSSPEKNPAPAPAIASDRAHGTVQISLPID